MQAPQLGRYSYTRGDAELGQDDDQPVPGSSARGVDCPKEDERDEEEGINAGYRSTCVVG